jgi:hypothetical protein
VRQTFLHNFNRGKMRILRSNDHPIEGDNGHQLVVSSNRRIQTYGGAPIHPFGNNGVSP